MVLPLPRRPLDPGDPSDQIRRWYENELGWPTVPAPPGSPLRLRVGPRFDVLDVPAEAGHAALRHLAPHSPVAVQGDRMRLLMAPGSAEELPAVLEWLEWGTLPLDLTTISEGGRMEAPLWAEGGVEAGALGSGAVIPERVGAGAVDVRAGGAGVGNAGDPEAPQGASWGVGGVRCPAWAGPVGERSLPLDRSAAVQGAAVWLRPPAPGGEVEASLPTLSALGGRGRAPDLVRVLDTVATQCHRLRLRRACARPPAHSRTRPDLRVDQALAFS